MFRALSKQGRNTPIERCAQMLLFLVSGRADALSGRFIRAQDNEDELVRRAEEFSGLTCALLVCVRSRDYD
jgi:hypothetical protein